MLPPDQIETATSEEPPGGSFFWLFHVLISLSKYRRRLFYFAVTAVVASVLVVPKLPLSYKSVAVIQVRKNLATALSENLGLKPVEAAGQVSEDYRVVQMGILEGGLLHQSVGKQLLESGYMSASSSTIGELRGLVLQLLSPSAEEQFIDETLVAQRRLIDAAGFVTGGLQVRRGHKSPKIELTFKDGSSERAQAALRIVLEQYKQGLIELYDIGPLCDAAEESRSLAQEKWLLAQTAFEAFSDQERLHDLGRQITDTNKLLTQTTEQILQVRIALEAACKRVESLELARTEIPQDFPAAPTRTENRYRWMVLDLLANARKRLLDSPFSEGAQEYQALLGPVDSLAVELDALPIKLVEANPNTPNPSHFKLVSDLARSKADIAANQASLDILRQRDLTVRARLASLKGNVSTHTDLERSLSLCLQELDDKSAHLYRLNQVRELANSNLMWSFKVLQEPSLPIAPSSPGRSLQLIAACLVTLGLAVVAVLTLGLADRSLREGRELERLFGVKALASFPDLRSRRELARVLGCIGFGLSRHLRAFQIARQKTGLSDFASLGPHAIVLNARIDSLITNLRQVTVKQDAPRILTLSGVHARAGVTTIAANLARRLAQREGRVLLAMRREDEQLPEMDGVDLFIYSDTLIDTDQFREGGLREWAKSFGSQYQTIIVDAPPVLGSSDALCMLTGSDVSMIVARGDVTPRTAIREAASAIDACGEGQVGVIFNAYHDHLPAALSCAS